MRKPLGFALLCLPLCLTSSGCSFLFDSSSNYQDDISLQSVYVPIKNYNDEYQLKAKRLKTYFVDGGSAPYVDVSAFLSSLEGLYQTEYLSYETIGERKLRISWRSVSETYAMVVDDEEDEISVSSMDFFNLIHDTSTTDYSFATKTVDYATVEGQEVTFSLASYSLDVYRVKDLVLIPFCLANTLFCSTHYLNFYYNGSAYYATYFDFAMDDGTAEQDAFSARTLGGGQIPEDVALLNARHFLFAMDYYYGLSSYYSIGTFRSYLGVDLLGRLSSVDEEEARNAMMEVLYTKLDEMHTSFDSVSFYTAATSISSPSYGPRRTAYLAKSKQLKALYETCCPDNEPIRYYDDTAIIMSPSPIQTGASSELRDSTGALLPDAYTKDSFYYMKEMLSRIEERGGINNILLDLSQNGGGNMGAVFRILGLFSDQDVVYGGKDVLSGSGYAVRLKVDADEDKDYGDEDAYSSYKWGILTSSLTFSAANYLACNASYSGAAKIYGERSGGGSCPIIGIVNADGSSFHISGPSALQNATFDDSGVSFSGVESGAEVDKELSLEYFYGHDEMLDALFD